MGAIEYWDANVDDARYVVTVLRTAKEHGAIEAFARFILVYAEDRGEHPRIFLASVRQNIISRQVCGPWFGTCSHSFRGERR